MTKSDSQSSHFFDNDYCIICEGLLSEHDEVKANECYTALTKRRLHHEELME